MARRNKRFSSESSVLSMADAGLEAGSAPLKAQFQEIAHPAGASVESNALGIAGESTEAAREVMNRAVAHSSPLLSRFRSGSLPYRSLAIIGASAVVAAFVVPRLISRRR